MPTCQAQAHDIGGLLTSLREIIRTARQQALRAVDVVQVRTFWSVGRHIVEFEQGGAARAAYGKRLLADLASSLTAEFGKGFDERNLRHMRAFYAGFPNWNALRSNWHHSLRPIKDKSVVRYSVLHGNEQLFASKYKLVLPSEEELRAELVREQRLLAAQSQDVPYDTEE